MNSSKKVLMQYNKTFLLRFNKLKPREPLEINKILGITKKYVKRNEKFSNYILHGDNQIFKDQLPLLSNKKYSKNKDFSLIRTPNFLHKNINLLNLRNNKALYNFDFEDMKFQRDFSSDNFDCSQFASTCFSKRKQYMYSTLMKSKSYMFGDKDNIFIDDILFDTNKNNENFIYDENEIFSIKNLNSDNTGDDIQKERFVSCLKFILNCYQNNNFANNDTELIKIYHKNKTNEMELKLKSIEIKFIPRNNNINSIQIFQIPIKIAPVFFINTETNLPIYLTSLFHFDDNFKNIIYEETQEFFRFLKNIKDSSKYHKNLDSKKIAINQYSIIISNNFNSKKSKKYQEFGYLWITPNNIFDIEIKMPLIEMHIKKTNTILQKYIDYQLFLYIYNIQMENWYTYLVNYLYSFKQFREIVGAISSDRKNNYSKFINENILLSKIMKKTNSIYDYKLVFIYTNNDNNNFRVIFTPLSYAVFNKKYAKNKHLNTVSKFKSTRDQKDRYQIFIFNINQFLFLLKINNYVDILEFLERFLENKEYSENEKYFNYSEFDLFINNETLKIEKDVKLNENIPSKIVENNNIFPKKIKIKNENEKNGLNFFQILKDISNKENENSDKNGNMTNEGRNNILSQSVGGIKRKTKNKIIKTNLMIEKLDNGFLPSWGDNILGEELLGFYDIFDLELNILMRLDNKNDISDWGDDIKYFVEYGKKFRKNTEKKVSSVPKETNNKTSNLNLKCRVPNFRKISVKKTGGNTSELLNKF